MNRDRYFLTVASVENWAEVTKEDFVSSERTAGFHNTLGKPHEPATGGFSGGGVRGKVVSPGGELPESFVPLKPVAEEDLKPLPPRVERLTDAPDSPLVLSFPKGTYEVLDDTDGHLNITLNEEQGRVWIKSVSEHIGGLFSEALAEVGGNLVRSAKDWFRR